MTRDMVGLAAGDRHRTVAMSIDLDRRMIAVVDVRDGQPADCFFGSLEQLGAAIRCAPTVSDA